MADDWVGLIYLGLGSKDALSERPTWGEFRTLTAVVAPN